VPIIGAPIRLLLRPFTLGFSLLGAKLVGLIPPILGSKILGAIGLVFKVILLPIRLILGFFGTMVGNMIRVAFALLGGSTTAAAMATAEAIRTFFRTKFALILRSGFGQAIANFVRVAIPNIARAGVAIVAGFVGWPLVIAAAAIAAITVFIVRFVKWFKTTDKEFENIGSAIVTFIIDGLKSMLAFFDRTVIQWFRDRIDGIKLFFENLQGDFENIGSAMVNGIVTGITSTGARIGGAIRKLVDGAVKNAKETLGIKSPSLVFAEIGDDVMRGMTLGIDRSTIGTVNSLRSAAMDLSGVRFDSPTVPFNQTPDTQGQTIINVTVTSADPQAVVEALRRYTRANGPLGSVVTV
jgi:hypothetical protein